MPRRLTNRSDKLRLHAAPPVTILELGLVQHPVEEPFGVDAGEMGRKIAPELGESLDDAIVAFQCSLEVVVRMHVHDHREVGRHEHPHRAIELGQMRAADNPRGIGIHHR